MGVSFQRDLFAIMDHNKFVSRRAGIHHIDRLNDTGLYLERGYLQPACTAGQISSAAQ